MTRISTGIAIMLLSYGFGAAQDQKAVTPKIRFVEQGYHMKAERIEFAEIGNMMREFEEMPAKLPKENGLTIGVIWEQLNRRLKESSVKIEVVIETNMHNLKADQIYFQAPIKKVYGHELQGDALRSALATATCGDLLSIIVENTGLHTLHRKNEIILSNYIHE